MQYNSKSIKELCRELRKNSTPVEEILWKLLRNRQFLGLKFVRQFPIIYGNFDTRKLFYIADFYCHEKQLILELDGKIHALQVEYDASRDAVLKEMGLKVIRFKNEELDNIDKFLKKLEAVLTHPSVI